WICCGWRDVVVTCHRVAAQCGGPHSAPPGEKSRVSTRARPVDPSVFSPVRPRGDLGVEPQPVRGGRLQSVTPRPIEAADVCVPSGQGQAYKFVVMLEIVATAVRANPTNCGPVATPRLP